MAEMDPQQADQIPQEQAQVAPVTGDSTPPQPAVAGETTIGAGGTEMPIPVVRPVRVIGKSEQPTAPQIPNVGIGSQEIDIINRGLVAAQERINKQERQETAIRSYLGERYDPYSTLDADPFVQMDMGRSESFANMQEKFQRAYPDGSFMSFPTADGPVFIARKGPNEPYQKIGVVWEGIGSMATYRTLGGTVGGIVGTAVRIPTAGPLLTGLGSFAGSELDRYIEGQKGLPEKEGSVLESAGGAALDAAMDAGMRYLFKIPYGPVMMSSAEKEAAKSAVRAARELGLDPPLGWGQVHPEGMVNRIFRQGLAFGGSAQELITRQEQDLLVKLTTMAKEELPDNARDIIKGIISRQTDSVNATIAASRLGPMTGTSRAEGGRAIQAVHEKFEFGSEKWGGYLFDRARAIADETNDPISFFIGDVRDVVNKAKAGVPAHGQITTEPGVSPIIDQFGAAIQTPAKNVETLIDVSPVIPKGSPLYKLMDDIIKLTDASPYLTKVDTDKSYSTAFEQIKELRTSAWYLKEESDDPNVRRWAGQIWYELNKSMNAPISGSNRFLSAWREAADIWNLRERTLEASFAARALIEDAPEALMTKYLNPNNSTPWGALYEIAGEKDWSVFRAAVTTNILNAKSGRAGLDMLEAWERVPANLNRTTNTPWGLFDAAEKRDLYNALEMRAIFESSPWGKIKLQELTDTEMAIASVRESSSGNLISAMRLAGLDPLNSETARLFRAGIYADIVKKATTTSEKSQFPVVHTPTLRDEIAYWQGKEGIDLIFSPADWRKLENFREVGAVIGAGEAGISGEIAAGEASQAVAKSIFDPVRGFLKGVLPYVSNRSIGYFLALPASTPRFDISQTGRGTLTTIADAAIITNNELREKYSRPEYQKVLGEIEAGTAMPIVRPVRVIPGTPQ